MLTDFGISLSAGDSRLTLADRIVGTSGFVAPERLRGATASPASDLWSLGATLYAAVEGHGPFERETDTASMWAVVNDPPPPARSAGLLAPLIARLLQPEPSARPSAADAERMFAEILLLIAGEAAPVPFAAAPPPYTIATTVTEPEPAAPIPRAGDPRPRHRHPQSHCPGHRRARPDPALGGRQPARR